MARRIAEEKHRKNKIIDLSVDGISFRVLSLGEIPLFPVPPGRNTSSEGDTWIVVKLVFTVKRKGFLGRVKEEVKQADIGRFSLNSRDFTGKGEDINDELLKERIISKLKELHVI